MKHKDPKVMYGIDVLQGADHVHAKKSHATQTCIDPCILTLYTCANT